MFTRPRLHHPSPVSAPLSPAGFRIADYLTPKPCFNLFQGRDFTDTRSPAPSPLSSPIKGPRHAEDDAPPTIRLPDLFAGGGFGTPKRPSTPGPNHPRNAMPNVNHANVPAQDPLLNPYRRKGRHGPKHLSFTNSGKVRPDVLPPHRRAQQLKGKRDTARKRMLDPRERRTPLARKGIGSLRREAEALMKPEHMNEQDKIFLKQLRKLELHDEMKLGLERCREQISRAAGESEKRRREHEQRDEEAAKMWGETQDAEAMEEQKRKVAEFERATKEKWEAGRRRMEEAALRGDEERQRAHDAMERQIREEQEHLFRQELARKAKEEEERRLREEWERRLQEEKARQLREEIERVRREAHERFAREQRERQLREERERRLQDERDRRLREEKERKLREEVERLRKEAHERFAREEKARLAREEQERQARLLAEQARRAALDEQARQYFALYEGKWNELRTNKSIPPIDVREMPWPVFGVISSADQITYQDVRSFLFHPQRPGVEGKTARDKVKSEVLRFHPDKFNTRIVPKIQPSQHADAQEIAGAVARILTRIMTEEETQQK